MNPLDIKLDFRSGVPIYVQIVEQVQQLLATGQIKPGDQLPTVRQLASEIRVNFNTVARAYRLLDQAGLISTQQGRGTYILDKSPEGLSDLLKAETLEDQIDKFIEMTREQGYDLQDVLRMVTEKITNQKVDEEK